MKKTIFLLSFVALIFGSSFAQDTVRIRDMRLIDRYFVPVWPDAFPMRSFNDEKFYVGRLYNMCEDLSKSREKAYMMYTNDTLQVYGIAASLSTGWRLYPDDYAAQIQAGTLDTSCEFMYDYLILYEADPDSLRPIGDDLLVNLRYTPVSYYIDLDLSASYFGTDEMLPILPVYERYFSAPVTVADSFYVGRRYRTDHRDGRCLVLPMISDTLTYGYQYQARYLDYVEQTASGRIFEQHGWIYYRDIYCLHPFLFPIIAPPDTTVNPGDTTVTPIDTVINPGDTLVVLPGDTLVIGGDTLVNTGDTVIVTPGVPVIIGGDTLVVNPGDSIIVIPGGNSGVGFRPNDLIYRYTNVAPNPARNSVRITSSFGLSRIEAYDLRGRLIYESPQLSTFSFPLSTIEWPRGTYLLRITTPAGTTTKKLLIQ